MSQRNPHGLNHNKVMSLLGRLMKLKALVNFCRPNSDQSPSESVKREVPSHGFPVRSYRFLQAFNKRAIMLFIIRMGDTMYSL
jgi:hypothetical protein